MSDLPMLAPQRPPGMPPGGLPMMPPQSIVNPAYLQWEQAAQEWLAEKKKRQQQFMAACDLIKDDATNRFKIDIEADSTIAADEQAEKQARTEFLTAITPFLEVVVPGMMQNKALAPLGKEIVMFAVRGFRVSRQLEASFETAFDALIKQVDANPQPPPGAVKAGNTKSPEEIAADAQTEKLKASVQMADIQGDAHEAEVKAQAAQQANAIKLLGLQSQEKIAADKLVQDQFQHEQSLSEQRREREGREALDQARMSRMANRDASGLGV